MGRHRAEIVLALIAVVDAGELTWDLAHGGPGTHCVLKIVVLVGAVAAIAVLRRRRGFSSSPTRTGRRRRQTRRP